VLKVIFHIILFVLSSLQLMGQSVQLERSVIGSAGEEGVGQQIILSYTVGEPVVVTGYGNTLIATQGFQQPLRSRGELTVTYQSQPETCQGSLDGAIFLSIQGCTAPYEVQWNVPELEGDSIAKLAAGVYEATITSSDGCESVVLVEVGQLQLEPCQIKIYSGITPNNDGKNDNWIIEHIDIFQPNVVKIFNRWGVRVWMGENYDNHEVVWGGLSSEGTHLPDGTYFYIIEANDEIYKGYVEIIR
jgi:gliding motility-associated-like protein